MDPNLERPKNVGYLLGRVWLRWRSALEDALAPLGLTHVQYAVLASLYGLSQRGGRPNQRQLSDFSGFDQMQVSKAVRALETAGLIERRDDPSDPRAYHLMLTRRGARIAPEAISLVHQLQGQLRAPLSADRRDELRRDLEILLDSEQFTRGRR